MTSPATAWRLGLLVTALVAGCGGAVASPGATGGLDGGPDGSASSSGSSSGVQSSSSGGAGGDAGGHRDAAADVVESEIAQEPPPQCPPPTFSLPSGSGVAPGTTVAITDPAVTGAGGSIYYTTDGTIPTPSSPVLTQQWIPIDQDVTVATAAANLPHCRMSEVAVATYTVGTTCPCPTCCPFAEMPTLSPSGTTSDNDLLVAAMSNDPGQTICYTLDGTTPTCNGGICTGTTQTYNAASRIAINGMVTDSVTGTVTVSAIGCIAGATNSSPTTQTYTLRADPPTMTDPAPSTTLDADAGPVAPTLSSGTMSSLSPANPVVIRTTTDSATAPTCATGIANDPGTTVPITGNTTIQAMTCKTGYLPSAVVTFDYAFGP